MLEKIVRDESKNFVESYRSQYMVSDTTHTRHIHIDGGKNNNRVERMDERSNIVKNHTWN